MGKDIIEKYYTAQFDGLKPLVQEIDSLRKISADATPGTLKNELEQHITSLENELRKYAESMQKKGAEVFREVA